MFTRVVKFKANSFLRQLLQYVKHGLLKIRTVECLINFG